MTELATKDLAAQIAAWAVSAAPALETAYSYPPADRGLLPDIAILITNANVVQKDARWPARGHALLRVFTVEVLIVVDPDPVDTATDSLTDIADALTFAILADRTLGGRVGSPGASSLTTFASAPDPAEIQFADGTLGRVGRMVMAVGSYLEQSR